MAEDLVARGITSSEQLGIVGASNSGLGMGDAFQSVLRINDML